MNKRFEVLLGTKFVYLPSHAEAVYEKLNDMYPVSSEEAKVRRKRIVEAHMLMFLSEESPYVMTNPAKYKEIEYKEISVDEFLEFQPEPLKFANVPENLKPFDKIIVNTDGGYFATLFSHYTENGVIAIDGYEYTQVLPYKEDLEHLLGK